jgi:hypothetical protein
MAELGLGGGKRVGKILGDLLERVLETPSLNTKEQLLAILREKYGRR